MGFRDRKDAGRRLAGVLQDLAREAPLILALPRGGVTVAAEIAAALMAPIDLLIVRKIGLPQQPELAMGAVVDGATPIVVRNEEIIRGGGISEAEFAEVRDRELAEIRRRRERYLGQRPPADPAGKTVIVVDDGIATGATTRAALRAIRKRQPRRLILAVPVAAASVLAEMEGEADEVVCLEVQTGLGAIGYFYEDFSQVSDEEVVAALAAAPPSPPGS